MDTERRVLTRCRTRLQANVLVSRLEAAGIPAHVDAGPGGRTAYDVRVPASDLDRARTVLNRLSGRDSPAGLLDIRRLIPALLVLAALVASVVLLVELFT